MNKVESPEEAHTSDLGVTSAEHIISRVIAVTWEAVGRLMALRPTDAGRLQGRLDRTNHIFIARDHRSGHAE